MEYRFDRFDGRDRYIGFQHTIPQLDPKLGSKGKVYLAPPNHINPYIGGRFSRRRLTINVGVIQYLSRKASLEIGYRSKIWETDNQHFGDTVGNIGWHDNNDSNMFYFGGRINF